MNSHKIIITGPECSGKTTLCEQLSNHFDIPCCKEYAREYLQKLAGDYNKDDLLKIAKGQLKAENKKQILDTDLITIKIWSEYKYGECDKWIVKKIEDQKKEKRFYILCNPDIKWQADNQRENPNDRKELFEIYKKELEVLGHDYFIVDAENRLEKIIQKSIL